MKKLLKVLAVFLTISLSLGILGKTEAKAGGSIEQIVCEIEPDFEVEADSEKGEIKITFPKQSYFEWDGTVYYPI